VQDDPYAEYPFIYVKLFDNFIVLVDTGCGQVAKDPNVQLKRLRTFLEVYPVKDNGGKPLNETRSRKYVVVCSHCHYDHICGVEQFLDSTLVASSYSKEFITVDLPSHSLCRYLDIPTPSYTISHWADDASYLPSPDKDPTPIQVMHTPGHTPDSLALYDPEEYTLYVGDTLYEWAPIIFPWEGDIIQWLASMHRLIEFVKTEQNAVAKTLLICCGHVTAAGPALEILEECIGFMQDILRGNVKVAKRMEVRGYPVIVYEQPGAARFVVLSPVRLIKEARRKMDFVVDD